MLSCAFPVSACATMRLQGVRASELALPANDADTRNLAGNAMSMCVVEQLLWQTLLATCADSAAIPNRWRELGVRKNNNASWTKKFKGICAIKSHAASALPTSPGLVFCCFDGKGYKKFPSITVVSVISGKEQ